MNGRRDTCAPFFREGGRPSIPPGVYFRMILEGYFEGLSSERGIAWRCADSLSLREFLGTGPDEATPEHSSLSVWRKRLPLEVYRALFVRVLEMVRAKRLLSGKMLGVDASTLEANAAMKSIVRKGSGNSYLAYVGKLAREAGAEAETPEEIRRFDKKRTGKKLSNVDWESQTDPEARIAKMKDGTTHLSYKAEHAVDLEGLVLVAAEVHPADKDQGNFTDPDSRIMKVSSTNSFEQCYNGQALVDDSFQVIVAASLSQQAKDSGEIEPILDVLEGHFGRIPPRIAITADAGYFSETNVMLLEDARIEPFLATGKRTHAQVPPSVRGRPPKELTPKERMTRKLSSIRGQKIYSRRKSTVEPVFGQIKQARGLRQFLLRGREKVSSEWQLWCLTHNLLKLYRHRGPV